MSYTLGSLFDGSGGFPLAGSLCDIVPKWAAEIEPYPIAVTRTRFPNMRHLGDISKISGAEIEPVDVITFGSPCQDLSVAGKRAGLKHEENGDEETTRSGLFMEAVRIIKEMREETNGIYPRFALWENVPGAFSSNKGEDFRTVCEELIKIVEPAAVMPAVPQKGWPYADSYSGDGWSLAYRVFDAQYWGVPQRRRRIHLVVDFTGQCARNVLFKREGVRGYFDQGCTPRQNAPGYTETSAGATNRAGEDAKTYAVDQGGGKSSANVYKEVAPTPTCTHGGEPVVAYTLKIRSGCEGGGKGALIQEDKSATLATNNDQYLFQPVIDGHILDDQGGQQISVRTDGKAPTLRAEMHGNIPCVLHATGLEKCREEQYLFENHSQDTRYKGPLDVCPMLPAQLGTGGNNTPFVVKVTPCYGIGNGQSNQYFSKEKVGTLNCMHDQQVIVFGKEVYNSGKNATGGHYIATGGPAPSLRTEHTPGVCVRYIVRRLTPTECARLQGFADNWGHIEKKDSLTPEEYRFWLEVRNTHAVINGKAVKEYTEKQMLTWYNKLHTDSAEYKMWGNGIALPPALYCMQGIADALGGVN